MVRTSICEWGGGGGNNSVYNLILHEGGRIWQVGLYLFKKPTKKTENLTQTVS